MVSRSSGRLTVPPASRPTWITVVQAAGSCSAVAARTMPETWVVRPLLDQRPSTWRPCPSSQRAGASRPSVRTSESSTSSTAGVGNASIPSRIARSIDSLRVRSVDSHWPPEPSPSRRTWGSQPVQVHSSSRPGVAEDADREVGGAAVRDGLAEQAARHGEGVRTVADDADDPGVGQLDLDGRRGQHGVGDDLGDVVARPA